MKLKAEKLTKIYRDQRALDGASFEIPECTTVALLGASGCGKSTLLRVLGGLMLPEAGSVWIDDQELLFNESDLNLHRRKVGMVFQSYNLFPHMTVLENIVLPLKEVHHHSADEARSRALELLERFNLGQQAGKKPSELSGGQRQRVAIVRALAIRAQLVLLDEPTSALDPIMTSEVLDLILELKADGKGIILASHHMGFVREISDWVIFMDQGRVVDCAPTPDFFRSPKSEASRHFLEKVLKH